MHRPRDRPRRLHGDRVAVLGRQAQLAGPLGLTLTSVWEATASVAAPDTPPLAESVRVDVAVVGAGYTGLAAALALAERGARAIVLEAREPGFGASGRNGGQVIPGLKLDPDALDRRFGEATTAFVGAAAEATFALIERLQISCGARRSGWIQATVKHAHREIIAARAEQWRRRGAPVEGFDAAAVAKATGARGFVGGWRDARGGVLHPLDYARGLCRAAQAAGAGVHGGSAVTSLTRAAGRWRLNTAAGASVEAEHVLLATNGYSDSLWPGLKQTILPARSCQIATAPLSAELSKGILPGGEAVSDTRRVGNYFRIGPGGRLMIGGRGPFREPRGQEDYTFLRKALAECYPEAAAVPIEHYWSGRVAMTADHLPHLHEPASGVIAALGYNGRGVALATSLGLAIGAHLVDRSQPLPFRPTKLKPLPLHGAHPLYGNWAIAYYRALDAMEN
jgi:glycine/D-amino acid oxidase-like deaminating enzyme